jgi:hypothetical protein
MCWSNDRFGLNILTNYDARLLAKDILAYFEANKDAREKYKEVFNKEFSLD